MSTQEPSENERKAARIESRLAAYMAAAGGAVTLMSSRADAVIVANTQVQPFGINGDVNIDFNMDGQIDFQIDHDRYNLNGTDLDYLQIDKNDVNGAANPLDFDPEFNNFSATTFPPNNTTPNNQVDAGYVVSPRPDGSNASYPSALAPGTIIDSSSEFDFQEGDNVRSSGHWMRANRLIDEDHTQIDQVIGGREASGVEIPSNGPNFIGLNGEIAYLGVKVHLNGADNMNPTYGWIGIRIDNEADATGAVVGYAYESTPNTAIAAGDAGPVVANADYDDDGDVDGHDFLIWQRANGSTVAPNTSADGTGDGLVNAADLALWRTNYGTATAASAGSVTAVPEPASMAMGGIGGVLLVGYFALSRFVRSSRGSE
jgi:hypothetical protein